MADQPLLPGTPIPTLTADEIVRYARGVVTQEYMLANVNDRDWQTSLMLLLSLWKEKDIPENCSSVFLIPMSQHMGGRWLNGRVPAVTLSATAVAVESVEPLLEKIQEFWQLMNPEEATS